MTALGSYLQIAAITISLGAVASIVRFVDAPNQVAVFYRVVFASAFLVAGLLLARRGADLAATARRPAALAMGLCLAVHWICFFASIRTTSVASAVFTSTSTPIFLAVLGPLLLRDRLQPSALIATVVGMAGVAVMIGLDASGDVRPEGVSLGLAAAALGAMIVISGKYLGTTQNVATVTAVQTASAVVVLLPIALLSGAAVSPKDLVLLAVLGVGLTAISLTLYFQALRNVSVQTAGVLGLLEPLSAEVLAWIVLGEPLTLATGIGGALIVAGVMIVRPRG
jgi:drug/metabolite transporter (DMT)-like permease